MFFPLPPQVQYETLSLEVAYTFSDGHKPVKRFPIGANGASMRVAIKTDPDRVFRKSVNIEAYFIVTRGA